MTLREQARWWGAGLVLLVVLLWLLADALLPFLLGMAIAYLSDPLADRLERLGLGRLAAVIVITVLAVGATTLAILLLLPSLIEQTQQAIASLPAYVEQGRVLLVEWLPEMTDDSAFLRQALAALQENAQAWSVDLLQRVLSGGLALIDLVLILVVTPVVAFYMLYDWDRMVAAIDGWLPRPHRPTIHHLAREVDRVLAGFVRGQLAVCLILGTFYAVALTLVGLDFGLLIGAFAGLISFIPYVGSVVGGVLSVGVAAVQFWGEPQWIVAVAVIFAVGQAVEGNVLTPNLVGGQVGLHPVWLMFALAAFGTVFGFIGLLVAVPAAAVIGVLGRFAIEQYKAGPLYLGQEQPAAAGPPEGPHMAADPGDTAIGFGTPAEELREISSPGAVAVPPGAAGEPAAKVEE